MAVDKLVDSTQLDADLTSVANAIRTKGGTSAQLAFPAGFVNAIADIPTGGGGDYVAVDWTDRTKPTGDIVIDAAFTDNSNFYYLLYSRTQIENVTFTDATYIPDFFLSKSGVKKLTANVATGLGISVCNGCTRLQYVVCPKVGLLYGDVFKGCTSLLAADFGGYTASRGFYKGNAFNGATRFATLVLRTNNVFPLSNISNFTNTPFASGKAGGTLYVPSALIASYQSATNWSTILGYANNSIAAIEGSIYETQYVDGTSIPTA